MADWSEKRRHRRVYFNDGEEVRGVFGPLDEPRQVEARILNLSLGGLYITVERAAAMRFRANDTVIMYELNAPGGFRVTGNLLVEVRRVEDQPIFGHIGYGCQFVDLDPVTKARMAKFLEWQFRRVKSSVA